MSYLNSSMPPSPFLTTSQHHYHTSHLPSTGYYPHYTTNSYTNNTKYLDSYSTSSVNYAHENQKYFPKQLINVLPGVSNLSSVQQQKLIHPLNTYSGSGINGHSLIHSPYGRGEIYYGNRDPYESTSTLSASTLINDLMSDSSPMDTLKKQNPFNKKYLLSQKNRQIENYAYYSTYQTYQSKQQPSYVRKAPRNSKKVTSSRQDVMNEQQMGEGMLRLAKKYGSQITGQKSSQNSKDSQKGRRNYDKIVEDTYDYVLKKNSTRNYQNYRQYQNLVQSQVDEKQFDSFGQGDKKVVRDSLKRKSLKRFNYDPNEQGQSLINGLTKMVSTQSVKVGRGQQRQRQKYQSQSNLQIPGQQSRRKPVFIDSDDDQRKSGTFKVPDAIIDELNNQRLPSAIIKREGVSERNPFEKEKIRYNKDQSVQAGMRLNPPNRIIYKGKTFQKIMI